MDELLFLESPMFQKWVRKNRLAPAVERLKLEISDHPETGDVIPGGSGLRKVRMAGGGRGKRGGFRVVYILVLDHTVAVLLKGYSKSDQENLSADERGSLVAEIGSAERNARKVIQERSQTEETGDGKTEE